MPKSPTIMAFSGFIAKVNPNIPPIKLTNKSKIPPSIPLPINFKIILIGITNNIPIIYSRNNPNTKANIIPKSIIPLLLYFLLYNRGQVK